MSAPVPPSSFLQTSGAPAMSPATPARAGAEPEFTPSAAGASAGAEKDASGDAYWSPEDDEVLLCALEEAQKAGKQSGGGWKPEVMITVAAKLGPIRKRGAIKTADNTRSHFRNLKTNWQEVHQLIQMSGFGWDEEGKRVTAEPDVWKQLLNTSPKYKKWQKRTFEHYARLDALCAKSTATGGLSRDGKGKRKAAKDAAEGDDDDKDKDEDGSESDDSDLDNLITPSRKRKRASAVGAMDRIAAALDSFGKTAEDHLAATLDDLLERDGDAFDFDDLSRLGMALSEVPSRIAVYRYFREREELRRSFLRKLLVES
ncbi:hypothetical protein CF326_g8477 [Tilletia indica]|nr:hypothetical protein CF326_g8477 [Tilletia indica]